jgi:hypothetical protein
MEKKIILWIQIAGWSGLLAASALLMLYEVSQAAVFLMALVIVIIFSAYLLATAKTPRWQNPRGYVGPIIFSFLFTSWITAILLLVAQHYAKAKQQ